MPSLYPSSACYSLHHAQLPTPCPCRPCLSHPSHPSATPWWLCCTRSRFSQRTCTCLLASDAPDVCRFVTKHELKMKVTKNRPTRSRTTSTTNGDTKRRGGRRDERDPLREMENWAEEAEKAESGFLDAIRNLWAKEPENDHLDSGSRRRMSWRRATRVGRSLGTPNRSYTLRPFLLAVSHRRTKDGSRMRVQLHHVFQLHPTGLVRRCYSFRCFRGSMDSRDEKLDTANDKLCMDNNRPGDARVGYLLAFPWRRRRQRHEWQDAKGA